MTDLTFRANQPVDSQRILYTPSAFARNCLLHLQEVGTLQALSPHKSQRSDLASYLFFIVLEGEGELEYDGRSYPLSIGSCVFIDCRRPYVHATSMHLWKLMWVHFDGTTMPGVYLKYRERGGQPVFTAQNAKDYEELLIQIYRTAGAEDHVRDMHINELLAALLSRLMMSAWSPSAQHKSIGSHRAVSDIKVWIDQHLHEKIALDDLADKFFINKFYLTRLFKEQHGVSIGNYILSLRISRAKELLRFSDLPIDEIGQRCGIPDANYFSRAFRKIEGVSPSEYRKLW